ncbi:hypothetical protein CUU64_17205 [Bacillus sp. V5-8f]|nr:hypothetical protein CUU64_17205 [Bacillus sp. V5-8f]
MKEAAKLLGISPTTLRRLETDNEVRGYGIRVYYTPGGQRRYSTSEIEHFFLNKGFSGKIGFGTQPVLLVIDCNTAFTNKEYPLHGSWDKEIEEISRLVDTAHQTDCPVIFAHSIFVENDPGLEIYQKKIPIISSLKRGIEEIELDPRIKGRERDTHLLSKYFSIYYETELLNLLRKQNCDTLIICGFSTSGAVRAVATETLQYGIKPIVPLDAVGDRDEFIHRSNIEDISRKLGDVVSTQEVVRFLYGRK